MPIPSRSPIFLLLLLWVPASAYSQGVLTPPAPPAPTMQTLDQIGAKSDQANSKLDALSTKLDTVSSATEKRIPLKQPQAFPITISQPGSYYLASNITGVSGQDGIRINSDNVTIDLNGFSLIGVNGSGSGISSPGGQSSVTVCNGIVRGWGGDGVALGVNASTMAEKITARNNGGYGIVTGNDSIVKDCLARDNASTSGTAGISVGTNSSVLNCASGGVLVQSGAGIRTAGYGLISHCLAADNAGAGGSGINAGPGSTVVDCTAVHNSSSNSATPAAGIVVGAGSQVSRCTASNNSPAANGISLAADSTAYDCIAAANASVGLLVTGAHCTVTKNHVSQNNTGIQVLSTSPHNRIDGNSIEYNTAFGLKVDSTANLIIRNTATSTGNNYSIVANNSGQAVVVPESNTATNNNAGGAPLGTTDPWVNITY